MEVSQLQVIIYYLLCSKYDGLCSHRYSMPMAVRDIMLKVYYDLD